MTSVLDQNTLFFLTYNSARFHYILHGLCSQESLGLALHLIPNIKQKE